MNRNELIILLVSVGLIIFGSLMAIDNVTCNEAFDCQILEVDKVIVFTGFIVFIVGLAASSIIIGNEVDMADERAIKKELEK